MAVEKIDIADPATAGRQSVTVVRRTPAIERLCKAGTLKIRHRLAAERLYLAHVVGEGGRMDEPIGLPMGSIPAWAKSGITDRQAAALKEYREARRALGTNAQAVIPVALYDLTLEELASIMHVGKDYARGFLVAGMNVLADFYGIAADAHETPLPEKR